MEWPFKENLVVLQDEMIPVLKTCCCGCMSMRTAALVLAILFTVRCLASDLNNYILPVFWNSGTLDSTVGIATRYSLDGPRSNPGGSEIFHVVKTGPLAHPVFCKIGIDAFPWIKRMVRGADQLSPFQTGNNWSWLPLVLWRRMITVVVFKVISLCSFPSSKQLFLSRFRSRNILFLVTFKL